MTGYELGDLGERYIENLLKSVGLDVQPGDDGSDLLIVSSGLKLEIKAALPTRRHGRRQKWFQFCLRRYAPNGQRKTDIGLSDIVILLAYPSPESEPRLYAIPSQRLGDRKSLQIAQFGYSGQWVHYNNFDRCLVELEAI